MLFPQTLIVIPYFHLKKWTWKSPDNITKNEIDYIHSTHKYIVSDIVRLKYSDFRKRATCTRKKYEKCFDLGICFISTIFVLNFFSIYHNTSLF
jgi:hypothetical protein